MSQQTSSGFWHCPNLECAQGQSDLFPIAIGLGFNVCPFCQTKVNAVSAISQQQDGDTEQASEAIQGPSQLVASTNSVSTTDAKDSVLDNGCSLQSTETGSAQAVTLRSDNLSSIEHLPGASTSVDDSTVHNKEKLDSTSKDTVMASYQDCQSLPGEKTNAMESDSAFVCPYCEKCTMERFFSEKGCPSLETNSEITEKKALFPYLDKTGLDEADVIELEGRLVDETKNIKIEFANLTLNVRRSLELEQIPLVRIKESIVSLDAFTDNIGVKVLDEEDKRKIEQAKTVSNIFIILHNYMSFFNYHILEHIVNQHGSSRDHNFLEKYVKNFHVFCKRNIFEVPQDVFLSKPRKTAKVFALKCTQRTIMQDIEKVRVDVAKIFGLRSSTLQLCLIEKGCVELNFLISIAVVEYIFPISTSQCSALSDIGVTVISEVETEPLDEKQSSMESLDPQFPPAEKEWKCPKCTLLNKLHHPYCEVCDSPQPNVISEDPPKKTVQQNSDTLQKETVEKQWKCPECTLLNNLHHPYCATCNFPQPNVIPEDPPSDTEHNKKIQQKATSDSVDTSSTADSDSRSLNSDNDTGRNSTPEECTGLEGSAVIISDLPTNTANEAIASEFSDDCAPTHQDGHYYQKSTVDEYYLHMGNGFFYDTPPDKSLYECLRGYTSPKTVEVVFHVIIPKPVWEWDNSSTVYLRFGCDDLGGWTQNIGDFTPWKGNNDPVYCEMSCSLLLNPNVGKKFIPYKYVIFTPKTRGKSICFEYLGTGIGRHKKRPVNRVLDARALGNYQQGGFHKYDTIAIPEDCNSWFVVARVKSLLRLSDQVNLHPFSLDMKQKCLMLYLEVKESKKTLSTVQFNTNMTIENYVQGLHCLFSDLSVTKTTTHDKPVDLKYVDFDSKNSAKLLKCFSEWLLPLVDDLSQLSTTKQLQGAVCILWCISKLKIRSEFEAVKKNSSTLIKLCGRNPTIDEQGQWVEYNNLIFQFSFNKDTKKRIAEAARMLSNVVSEDNSLVLKMDWICSIQLYSLFSAKFSYNPGDNVSQMSVDELVCIWCLIEEIFYLNRSKEIIRREKSLATTFVETYYSNLNGILSFCLPAMQAFVYVCPSASYCKLFRQIPPNVSVAWLIFVLAKHEVKTPDKWKRWIQEIEKSNFPRELNAATVLLEAVKNLINHLTDSLRKSTYNNVVIVAATSLLCTTLDSFPGEKEKLIVSSFQDVSVMIREWVYDPGIIGENIFGHNVTHRYDRCVFHHQHNEIVIWNNFRSLKCKDKRIHGACQELVKNLFTERVENVPDSVLVALLRAVDDSKEGTTFFVDIVTDYAKKAAKNFSSKDPDEFLKDVENIVQHSSESEYFGKFLGAILLQKYPDLAEKNWISLDILLNWTVWPKYIEIIQQGGALMQGLPDDCQLACTCASSLFRSICTKILSGTITVHQLHMISTNLTVANKLCKVIEDEELSYKSLEKHLKQRIEELRYLQARKKTYQTICNKFTDPSQIIELMPLKSELLEDISDRSICKLCSRIEHQSGAIFHLHCYSTASPLQKFAPYFDIMMKNNSSIFVSKWERRCNIVESTSTMKIAVSDIFVHVWQPVFEECRKLAESIIDQSIKLFDIDTQLKKYSKVLDNVVEGLVIGVSNCLSQKLEEKKMASSAAVIKIRKYWKVCEYHVVAQAFLRLKEILSLKGDFSLLEEFLKQVTTSLNQPSLNSIDITKLADTGSFLQDIFKNERKSECLQTFIKCQKIVEWLKEVTPSFSEIQGFVTVALTTAAGGEGDLVNDKLSNLRMVGNGFASLIYEVKETDGYEELKNRCKSLWKALEKNPKLPTLLSSCNDDLEWYVSVKKTQGTVEKTSYGQMKTILKCGMYIVHMKAGAKTVNDLIFVILHHPPKNTHKRKYSLDELQDLESKLVLICGNKAKARTEVDHYLNLLHSATRIANLYLALQRAGEIKYSNVCLRFWCTVNKACHTGTKVFEELDFETESTEEFNEEKAKQTVFDLHEYTRLLDIELSSWKASMDAAREKYYELNYFTTLQLLKLRKKLGKLLQSISTSVSPSVLMLLKSISPMISSQIIIASLKELQESQPTNERSSRVEVNSNIIPSTAKSKSISEETQLLSVKNNVLSLTCENLEKSQQKVYYYFVYLGYNKDLILGAVKKYGSNTTIFIIEQWCKDNNVSIEKKKNILEVHEVKEQQALYDPEESEVEEITTQTTHFPTSPENSAVFAEKGSTPTINNRIKVVKRAGKISIDEEVILVELDDDAGVNYLELDKLGKMLLHISCKVVEALNAQRAFHPSFKTGLPNLLITSPDNVMRTVLALYATDTNLPLPTPEEVLLCTSMTTSEEVCLLWRRAIRDPGFKRIFCLAHAENLPYDVCNSALRSLFELSQGKKEYRLVVISSKEDEERSHMVSGLHLYKRPIVPTLMESDYKEYLKTHFIFSKAAALARRTEINASNVDPEGSTVRVVSSTRSGMGKSLYIKRRVQELSKLTSNKNIHITIPVHGPIVSIDTLLDVFKNQMKKAVCKIIHLDIAPRVLHQVDTLLFSLLILNGLSDNRGNVWRCHPSQLYLIEVTLPENMENKSFQIIHLLKILPTINCVSPKVIQKDGIGDECLGMDEMEFRSPTNQRVFQYLTRYITNSDLDSFSYQQGKSEGCIIQFLEVILKQCSIDDPSWAEIRHFVKFLDVQLSSCETSVFFNAKLAGDVLSGFKGFAVKFMIKMSQDFSTPSLKGLLASKRRETTDDLVDYQIAFRRQWEQSSHPYLFFNDDRISVTFVGFKVTPGPDCHLIDPSRPQNILERFVMSDTLYNGLRRNGVVFDEDYRQWDKKTMISKLARVFGLDSENCFNPDTSYALTTDNLVKMLAIQMRFRCGIPVVVMGETGCGKTRLIRYMCDLARQGRQNKNMFILKIHGGITEKNITKFIEDAEKEAEVNKAAKPPLSTVVFFDEANTTESIGLIKEIMCDQRINGRTISKNLSFIAACNPYRKHSKQMIKKLENAGLGFYVQEKETQQKLGKIPLRQLVYRVLDLPPSMKPLVYDFGQLNTGTESDYIKQIVTNHLIVHQTLRTTNVDAITKVLEASQSFMRNEKNECSYVSLRDVERAMVVFKYFYDLMPSVFTPLIDERAKREHKELYGASSETKPEVPLPPVPKPLNRVTSALVLSLSVCYHARLQERENFENLISQAFKRPLKLPGGAERFRNEIKWCQEGLLDSISVGKNIAKNAALRENVFMMAICIELRIPLFLVGKPGSSKSLAKSIIKDSMHGQASTSQIFNRFKEVFMLSYQCSQLSTPESVIGVFESAQKFQSSQDLQRLVSAVVLDEVGLAEDSPTLPLKALHPLLEDGTEGAGKNHQQKTVERQKRVAFIGISNWALDPAKMNRGVMVVRGEPELRELVLSARGICSTADNDSIREQLQNLFEPLSQAYINICSKQKRQFFGLRDFYSLIKMLYWMCSHSDGNMLSRAQVEHAIKRNFGGLESEDLNPLDEFLKEVGPMLEVVRIDSKQYSIQNPDNSKIGLLKASLGSKDISLHGENRYLLFLTENYAALDILKHFLRSELKISDEDVTSQPLILFGSSFPKDKEFTQVCRNINRVKICMETGRTVILLNLESLYESLYDVLNQYYMNYGGMRYVDLGLQTHRVKCRVHEKFKLILIAEKETVYKQFPTPLINRMEKHFVLTSTVLVKWQREILDDLIKWIEIFSKTSDIRGKQFEPAHAFIGYQKDTPAAVIFHATNQLKRAMKEDKAMCHLQEAGIFSRKDVQDLKKSTEDSVHWSDMVLKLSKFLLLQTAAIDAVVRLSKSNFTKDEIKSISSLYYENQHHSSIVHLLRKECRGDNEEVFLQVTTHSPLMTHKMLALVEDELHIKVTHFNVQEFDTELDFTNQIGSVFQRESTSTIPYLLILQCDSGHLNWDLIASVRYRVYDEAIKIKAKAKNSVTHVVLVVRLPQQEVRSQFVGFQGDPWLSVHIDDLRPTSEATVLPEQALKTKISELFIGQYDRLSLSVQSKQESLIDELPTTEPNDAFLEKVDSNSNAVEELKTENLEVTVFSEQASNESESFYPQHRRLLSCVQTAVSMLKDSNSGRSRRRIHKLIHLLPSTKQDKLDNREFYDYLVTLIHKALQKREGIRVDEKHWALMEAMNSRKLQSGGTFRNVLVRRIDEVITPYLTKVIANIDQNCNLDLLNIQDQADPVSQFWLAMFKICGEMIDFKQLATGKAAITVIIDFDCKLPFSWIIKDTVNALIASNIHQTKVKENELDDLKWVKDKWVEQLYDTKVGVLLKKVTEENSTELYNLYLYDFVRYMYKDIHNNSDVATEEYELLMNSLNVMASDPDLCSVNSLPHKIVSLHLVNHMCNSKVVQFRQLTMNRPEILHSLSNVVKDIPTKNQWGFTLHLAAVQQILESDQDYDPFNRQLVGLNPPVQDVLQTDVTQSICRWLNHVRLSQNIIEAIIYGCSINTDQAKRARLAWQRVKALQFFVERVYLPHSKVEGMLFLVRRLEDLLRQFSDFLKKDTLVELKLFLNNQISTSQLKTTLSKINAIKRRCNRFFIDIVCNLCFGGKEAPEQDLVKLLMDIVLQENQTNKLSPFNQPDEIPTVRSFLLQLLLEQNCSVEQVQECLDNYIQRSIKLFKGQPDQQLCLICIQCFENACYKRVALLSNDAQNHEVAQMLKRGLQNLHSSNKELQVTLNYLLSVAEVRFGLSIVARQLETAQTDVHLLQIACDLCSHPEINKIDLAGKQDISGPVMYLIKLLVRQFGLPSLKITCKAYPWLIPEQLRSNQEEEVVDPFVVYGKDYIELRNAVKVVVFTKNTEKLIDCASGNTRSVFLALALYQRVTLSRASKSPTKQVNPGALQVFNTFIQDCTGLSLDMIKMQRLLLANQQGGSLAQMTVSPEQPPLYRTLGGIVIHAACVILNKPSSDLLVPLLNILQNPIALKDAFLPTMPEDLLQEARDAVKAIEENGKFYKCPRGHPYFIGDCGKPYDQGVCQECGASIGAKKFHELVEGNVAELKWKDTTKTGYDLGDPDKRSINPENKRGLSAPAVSIVRAILHSLFIWTVCTNENHLAGIAIVAKHKNLPEFFWKHLEKDLECLRKSIGKGVDDCAMIIHLVLQQIFLTKIPSSPDITAVKNLQSKDARKKWENIFFESYINPILKNLVISVNKAMDLVVQDDPLEERDHLFYLAYEKVKVDESKLEAHVWTFRPQIDLEYLKRDVQAGGSVKVLDAFLQIEPSLRATQYLPDIVKLQWFLFDMYNKYLSEEKAHGLTIRDFLKQVKENFNDNTKNECELMFESLRRAWTLVGHKLKNHSNNRIVVKEKYLVSKFDLNTPLVNLIPTTMREGTCTTALVDYLVITHNNFIEKCRGIVCQGMESTADVWRKHKVPITHIQRCHIIDYEKQIQSIILSHYHFSLTLGKGEEIDRDLPALEKHILNQFIYGKPTIQLTFPEFAYLKDIYTVETFLAIRRKVMPQVVLTQQIKHDIVNELQTTDQLRESLDVVEIVMGLLSSGGGHSDRMLKNYVRSHWMSNRSFSYKAKQHCTLGHILSLWETISVALARQLWERREEPFEAVPQNYLLELKKNQIEELNKCLRMFDLNLLLGALFEFIEVHVKQITTDNEMDYAMVDAFEDYWSMTEQNPLNMDHFRKEFPGDITVAQAVAAWKHIAKCKT